MDGFSLPNLKMVPYKLSINWNAPKSVPTICILVLFVNSHPLSLVYKLNGSIDIFGMA